MRKKRKKTLRVDRRLAATPIVPEETVEIRDASGTVLRRLVVESEKPDPEMFGQVQIASESETLPVNYAITSIKREEQVIRYAQREAADLLRKTKIEKRQER
jgi:hypothetical protein